MMKTRSLPTTSHDDLPRRDFLRGCLGSMLAVGCGLRPSGLAALGQGALWTTGLPREDGLLSYPLPSSDGVVVDRDAEVILVRREGMVYAFALSCPHQRSMLKWREKNQQFKCTKHGSKYQPSGEYVSGRATRAMDRIPVRLEGDRLVVDASVTYEQDADPLGWEGAKAVIP